MNVEIQHSSFIHLYCAMRWGNVFGIFVPISFCALVLYNR